jgi:hypothetical protein
MKHILSLLLLCFSVSGALGRTADSVEIARFWNEYHELWLKKAPRAKYWHTENNFIERGFIPRDSFLPHKIESITAFNDSVCVITLTLNNSLRSWYKVGVLTREEGCRLVDYFELTKGGLDRVESRYADIYHPPGAKPADARRIDDFIEGFCDFYGLEKPDRRMEYFKCRDVAECFRLAGMGFDKRWGWGGCQV